MSLPQIPHASTRTKTSSGPTSGSGTSVTSICSYSVSSSAFIERSLVSEGWGRCKWHAVESAVNWPADRTAQLAGSDRLAGERDGTLASDAEIRQKLSLLSTMAIGSLWPRYPFASAFPGLEKQPRIRALVPESPLPPAPAGSRPSRGHSAHGLLLPLPNRFPGFCFCLLVRDALLVHGNIR